MVKKITYWFKNYWDYYKWPVFIGIFIIGIILFCIFNTGDKKKYDSGIVFAGNEVISIEQKNSISLIFAQMLRNDTNNDGNKNIDFIAISGFTDEQIEDDLKKHEDRDASFYGQYKKRFADTAFSQHFGMGEASIFILSDDFYKTALESGALVKLSDVLGFTPENANDEYSIRLSELSIYSWFSELSILPEDTLICIRGVPQVSAIGKSSAEENYNISAELFKNIVLFNE